MPAWLALCLSAQLFSARATEPPAPRAAEHFERSVRPLLLARCVECHGADTQEAQLRLDTADCLARGGVSGAVVVPGDPDASRLIQLVRGTNDLRMPPDDPLSATEIVALERWVRDGAVWPGDDGGAAPEAIAAQGSGARFTPAQQSFWAFQPPAAADPPAVSDTSWPAGPVDQFILARLEAAGIPPSPPADKRILLRRVTFDLTGLPPTHDEMAAFLADDSPDAYPTVVERLLSSPHYGERWAQHWLDVVRFAESAGHDGNNAYLHAWRYRDYVIRAFNTDTPYDQFIVEQLAGDLLPKTGDAARDFNQMVATGFLQVGPKPVVMRDKRQMLLDIADEQLHTTAVAFMGLTVGCARCHDHKFDPVPTSDYYSLAGIFTSTHVMADQAPDSKWLERPLADPTGEQVTVMCVEDLPEPHNLPVHQRGNYRTLGGEAPRRFLQIMAGSDVPALQGSGRLELARWIASPSHPLTARVMVNRLWQHHFGRGLVATSNNFGKLGARPTHPELLDWLAARFVESGWSVKAMHRLMVLSRTYRQQSGEHSVAAHMDPDDRLLWRMPRRRLSAEELRDAMLAASGSLDRTLGGTLFTEGYQPGDASRQLFVVDITQQDPFPPFQSMRRSVYLPVLRNARPELLKLFDAGNEHATTAVRGETTVATQGLFLLNSPFVRGQADALALAVTHGAFPDTSTAAAREVIDQVFGRVLGRPASASEQESVLEFLAAYLAQWSSTGTDASQLAVESAAAAHDSYVQLTRQTAGLASYHQLRSLAFNGRDQHIQWEFPRGSPGTGMTLEVWVYPQDVRDATLVGRDGPGARLWRIGTTVNAENDRRSNQLFYEFYPGQAGGRRSPAGPSSILATDQWSLITITYGEGRRRLYVNAQLMDECDVQASLDPARVPLTLGARGDPSEWFCGRLDHVALYDRPLSAVEVEQHHVAFRRCHWSPGALPARFAWRAVCQALLSCNEFCYVD